MVATKEKMDLVEIDTTKGSTQALGVTAYVITSSKSTAQGKGTCWLICNFVDKSSLREAYDNAIKKSQYLQEEYFTEAEWTSYHNKVIDVAARLLYPADGNTDYTAVANNLNNQVEKMEKAITATEKTYTYELADGSPATAKRSDVLNQGTANVYHVLADIDESGELKGVSYIYADGTLHSNAPETAADGLETKPYFYGDTVVTGYNDYEGYNYYGYYLSTSGAKWADNNPNLGTVTGDIAAQGTYGSTGHNRYTLVKSPNITYTYVYSKDPSGVYMDWGESEQSFMNKQNLVNLKNVNVNTAFTGDDTYYNALSTEVAVVDTTDTDAFSFTVRSPGYNLMTPKSEGLKDYFDFSKMVWGGDAANNKAISGDTMILDNENETVTLRVDKQKTNSEGNPYYDGYVGLYETNGAMWMTLVPGKKYRLSYNYKNNNYSQVPNVTLAPYAFFSNDQNSWAGGCANHYDPFTEEEGEDILEFTVPTGYKYVSLRFGCTTQNADITFSDIHVVEISDANRFAKMTDLFFENAATGLEGGKTYTVSFKSSLRYDDYRWYAMNMYGEASPEMDWAHEQGTIQMFISTTSNGDNLYNYTVPVRITTGVSGGGTIGTFELPEGCTNINLGFCITNDTAIGGWVDDIRIVEGDYVEVGAVGETYNLPTPLREGYSFDHWSEKSTPFHGILGTGNPYTYGVSSDTVLANWRINKYDITFDNEFDFDKGWDNPAAGTFVDYSKEGNYFRTQASGTDNYVLHKQYIDIVPGHTYKISYKYVNNNTDVSAGIQNHFFMYDSNKQNQSWLSDGQEGFTGQIYYYNIGASGTISYTVKVPEGKEFARFRLGTCNNSSADVTFSDIYIQDISRGTTTVEVDDTVSEPQYNNTDIHGVIREYQQVLITDQTDTPLTTMPTMTSDGYFFKGWFTEKTGGTQVTDTSGYKTHAGTNQLWSQWQVHIEYDLSEQGGAYLDPEQAPKTSEKFDVGTIVNATIDDYVPYKVGYNFKGWKDKFMHNTYQPGQTVEVLGYSLILEPIWEAATDVSKDQDYEQITTLHPGQVYFYAYTPTTNNEYASGYVYGTDSNLSVSLYNGDTVTAGTKYDAATTVYGVNGVKTIVSGALTKGTKYYFGVTSASGTKTEVSGEKFKVSEHVVRYTLNGGEGTPATQTVYGHYNTDLVFEEPTRTGHTFMNWSTAPDQNSGSEITQSFTNGLITSSTGFVTEKTMYAAWSANSYALGLYAYYNEATGSTITSSHKKATDTENGGLIKISGDAEFVTEITTSIVYNQPVTVEAEPATGYSFKGWYANPTFSGETITAWGDVMYSDAKSIIEHMPANSLNLYARFDINTYVVNLYAYSNSGTNPEEYELSSLGGTVYFDNGTGAISATQRYVHGQSYTMHAVPATGYAFEGWYYGDTPLTGGAASGKEDQKIDLVKDAYSDHACDHSYKAKFSVQKAKLTVSGNGGSPAEQEFEGYMGSTVNVTQPTRDGYTFDGWTLVDNKTQGKPNGTLIDGVYTFGAGSDNATANWKVINYPITVDPAGGTATVEYKTGDVISNFTQTITQSTKFSVAYDSTVALRAPSKTGHTFDKWVKSDTATGGDLVVTSNGTEYKVGLNDAAVITATWTVNTYPLIVSAWSDSAGLEGKYSEGGNGGTVKFGEVTSQKIEDVVNYGSTATIYAIPAEGYTFLGWQTVEPSTKEALELIPDASAEFVTAPMGTQGLHYYAVFGINQYTVDLKTAYNTPDAYNTFVKGTDGGTVTGSGEYSHNQTATLTATPKTGYAFKGWCDGETEVSVNPTYTVTVNKDIALTAKFTVVEYTITPTAVSNYANNQDQFNGNSDAGYFKDQNHNFKYYYGQETEIEAIANPGYEFKGWFSDFALTHEIGDKTSVLKVLVTESTTYYAKFEVIKVAVNLFAMSNSGSNLKDYAQNAAGGKVSYDNVTYDATANGESYFGGNYTIYAKAETGYTFDGWYTNAELTGEPFTGSYSNGYYSYIGTADNADGVNLYAKFSVGAYDLNVFAYSNTGIGLTTYNNNNVGGTVDVAGDFIAGDKVADSTNARVTAKVYFDKVATVIATPKKGYTFGGWYTSNNSFAETSTLVAVHDPETNSYKLETSAMGIEGLNYYAKFEVGSFNIVYNANGGSDITAKTGTAYYNTAFNITQETPVKAGHSFLGWSVENASATTPDYKAGLNIIDAATISQWYTETYNGSDVTLYAVWVVNANFLIATAAYSSDGMSYKIGPDGGTVTVRTDLNGELDESSGYVVVPEGQIVRDYLVFDNNTGYVLKQWRWKYNKDLDLSGEVANGVSIKDGWGNEGTGQTPMPSEKLYVVAFFSVQMFSAKAKAYYNTAAKTDVYSYGATGGTVKCGANGKSASNAVSENAIYGDKVLFIADPARGYTFMGWYGEPTFVNQKVTDWGELKCPTEEYNVVLQDTSAEGETANNYYAVFTINFYKATASVRTYTVREELIYSLTEDKWPGGNPDGSGGVVGISTKPITEEEALSGAWKNDADWEKTGVYANEIYPCKKEIYYGQRVYFAAIANPGYVFGGWYDKQDAEYYGENLVEEENLAYSRIMREGDIYMEAKFVPVSFTLILDANGGVQGNPTEIIVTCGTSLKIEDSSAPTKTGSTFK
ncbi:MAG: InlB B-repeat-containing protein, partial [Clostridia bacterium]|nr:InlB B-repeat-containing protein [Clostridia bacterium]